MPVYTEMGVVKDSFLYAKPVFINMKCIFFILSKYFSKKKL